MAIERYVPERKNVVMFSFATKEEGVDALKMAIDLVAGECGDFTFIPPCIKRDDPMMQLGYLGFAIRGDINAISGLTIPKIREDVMKNLGISSEQLNDIIYPYLRRFRWYRKTPNKV